MIQSFFFVVNPLQPEFIVKNEIFEFKLFITNYKLTNLQTFLR